MTAHAVLGLAVEAPEGVYAPRSDTELLARVLLEQVVRGSTVLDLCTGTGALALVAARAGARAVGVDRCARAVAAARDNARRTGLTLEVLQGDLYAPVAGRRFDLVVANPPYLPAERDDSPHWDAGPDGRALVDRICAGAPAHLHPGGSLLLVQSSLTGTAATLAALERHGLEPCCAAAHAGPPGPVARAREAFLRARGLWPEDGLERLSVLVGRRPAMAAVPEVDGAAA
jgi:release factor glutamine methyltransferase